MDAKLHKVAALLQTQITGIQSVFVLGCEGVGLGQREGKERAKRG
jgi:hypothetical protein